VGEIDHYGLSNGESALRSRGSESGRGVCSMPSSQSLSALDGGRLQQMTSSLLVLVRVVFPEQPPTPGYPEARNAGTVVRDTTFISHAKATMLPVLDADNGVGFR